MTIEEAKVYEEMCDGCDRERFCHVCMEYCDAYLMRVEELEGEE